MAASFPSPTAYLNRRSTKARTHDASLSPHQAVSPPLSPPVSSREPSHTPASPLSPSTGKCRRCRSLADSTSRCKLDPGESHWIAVKNILKYLRRTKDMFLVYGGQEELVVNGYTDASFQTDKDDFRSQFGFVFCLNGGAVSWKSSKQDTVIDSTT
uniref:Retrotransposon protein, putative, Ty1-copia subclass n=2 Tax=Oryza sativa subsp. japonica TaxID=39947 RepID=Q53K56_ORYSJ|nr:retrotransposon protein, putative, Ty1-copia sub-class [Oryza sativa Japonica Group]ABA93175.1 retrotransposon protein, putative, Ty1-copia subclass [Oryza sativa Japonica Group]